MWEEFVKHRQQFRVTVHDRDLRMRAVDKTVDLGLDSFKASQRFIAYFEREHKIKSCKVTHTVTRKDLFPELTLQPKIDTFRRDI